MENKLAMYQLFKRFLQEKIADFRKIVWKTKGEMALEDLQNQAWVVAQELGEKRGLQVDFSQPMEQDMVMSALYVQSVKRREKIVQYAVRIDEERPGEDGPGQSLAERLPARESSDPLVFLLAQESTKDAERIAELKITSSYSQATAYTIALHRLGGREKLCKFLLISNDVFLERLRIARRIVLRQDSLFDRIERVSKTFQPLPGKLKLENRPEERPVRQLGWTFF